MKTRTNKPTNATSKPTPADLKVSRCNPEESRGLFFVIQALLPGEEPFNAMVFATDAQLDELLESQAMALLPPQVDKRELIAGVILQDLGLPLDVVIGAKIRLEVFENEAEARAAIARNRASNADFVRAVNASRN